MTAPDLTMYRAVHEGLRQAPHRLATSAMALRIGDRTRIDAFAKYWRGYAAEVLLHHTVEDDLFFPALIEKVPVAAELIARTDAEHEELDELMAAVHTAVEALVAGGPGAPVGFALAALADHMDHHLDFEDADILPLFERHFTAAEYEALDQQARKGATSGKQAAFAVPFIVYWMAPEEVERLQATAPLPVRLLWKATRKGHARLAARAMGDAADRSLVLA